MKLPPELVKYAGQPPDADDNALVKVGTMKRWIAAAIGLIPRSGNNIKVRRAQGGDVWTALGGAAVDLPWMIDATGHINPAYINFIMPTLGTEPLDTTANVLDLSQDGDYIWFQLNFTPVYVETFLASWTLDSVSVEQGPTVPTADADTKYIVLNAISGGAVASPSYFTQNITVRLLDYGPNDTLIEYNP